MGQQYGSTILEEAFEWRAIEGESPVIERWVDLAVSRVARSTWNSVWICEDHLVRLSTTMWPIVKQYREGKVKRTPGGEWNRTWNREPTSNGSPTNRVTVCLLKNEPATYRHWRVKPKMAEPQRKRVLIGRLSVFIDPNPGDLTMARMKLGWYQVEVPTEWSWKFIGWAVVSGEMPIEPRASWFSPKYV